MRPCKVAGCSQQTRGHGWCTEHRAAWKRGERLTTGAVQPAQQPVPAPAVVVVPGRQKCNHCTGWFPALVDGDLCIRCDSLLYPSEVA